MIVTNCIRGGKTCIENRCEDEDPGGEIHGCAPGLEDCGTGCTDVNIDALNCGACGKKCDDGQSCTGGKCDWVCADTSRPDKCDDGCHDFNTDPLNCGDCNAPCGTGLECLGGTCQKQCDNPDETACGTECYDLQSDDAHCGFCDTKCDAQNDEHCIGGICQKICPGGTKLCGNDCLDLESDATCGTCEDHKACKTDDDEICLNNRCQNPCADEAGTEWCADAYRCIDKSSDHDNCGGCGEGFRCGDDELCVQGGCSSDGCPAGQVACGGTCVEPGASALYCGAAEGCQTYGICGKGAVCDNGSCACDDDGVAAGHTLCAIGGNQFVCADPDTDLNYCGCTADDERTETVGQAGLDCASLPHVKQGGATCTDGTCVISQCEDGWADCDGQPENGCEADLTSTETCGSCQHACVDAHAIESETRCIVNPDDLSKSTCQYTCQEGMASCQVGDETHCIDTQSDAANCGYCGHNCLDDDPSELNGLPASTCNAGFCRMDVSRCKGNGYASARIENADGKRTDVEAYCLYSKDNLIAMRNAINNSTTYPADNAKQAYVLMNDIDLGTQTDWSAIGNVSSTGKVFKGVFMGNGYKISGTMTVNYNNSGLFGQISNSIIYGLRLGTTLTTGVNWSTANLAGYATDSYIAYTNFENCSQTVPSIRRDGGGNEIDHPHHALGVGFGHNLTMKNIKASGNIVGYRTTGGVAARVDGGVFENIDSSVNISVASDAGPLCQYWGGVVAHLNTDSGKCTRRVKNVRYTGKITGGNDTYPQFVGGIIGNLSQTKPTCPDEDKSVSIDDAYFAGEISIKSREVGGIIGYNSTGSTTTLNLNNPIVRNKTTAEGAAEEMMYCGINCGGIIGSNVGLLNINNAKSYTNITASGENTGGLIGIVQSHAITINDSFSTGNIAGPLYTGGIVGWGSNMTMDKVHADGDISATILKDNGRTGGLVASSVNSTYTNVYTKGDIKGGWRVGGILGESVNNSVTNCAQSGNVSNHLFVTERGQWAGGILGTTHSNTSVTNCVSLGDVDGYGSAAGIVVHFNPNNISITNSYQTGNITYAGPSGYNATVTSDIAGTGHIIRNVYYLKDLNIPAIGAASQEQPSETGYSGFSYNADGVPEWEYGSGVSLFSRLNSNNEWVQVKCKLPSGPKKEVTIPLPATIGAAVCK